MYLKPYCKNLLPVTRVLYTAAVSGNVGDGSAISFGWCIISGGYSAVSIGTKATILCEVLATIPEIRVSSIVCASASLIMSRHACAHMFPYLHVYISVCALCACAFKNL